MPITSSVSSSSARPAGRSDQRGFSIAAVTVSLFLLSVISLIFYQIFIGTMRTNMMLESHNDLAKLSLPAGLPAAMPTRAPPTSKLWPTCTRSSTCI